jgi:hypothetical protein
MIQPVLFYPGDSGVPGATPIVATDLWGRVTSYEHSITATSGFESARITATIETPDDAAWWFGQLMAHAQMIGPDAEVVWEGLLVGAELSVGRKRRARSLDGMANRIQVRYNDAITNAPATTAASDSGASQRRYGVRTLTLTLNDASATEAGYVQAQTLAAKAAPAFIPTTAIADGDDTAAVLTLTFAGWYTTLGWLTTSSSTVATAVTTTQVDTLITAYTSTNNWFSSTRRITASGISATQYIEDDTTYRQAIERLLAQGNGTTRYAWGVYEGRQFVAAPWAMASLATARTYVGDLGQSAIHTGNAGARVAPYNLRPDSVYIERDMLDFVVTDATTPDGVGRQYVERVTYREDAGTWEARLEGQTNDGIDATIAVITGKS